ncbi:MAG TPA: hypothetical protein VG733_10775 [Chthoniobacteraceae bacterium]|nr:hypothetical protein [Chthoniobacteraceae bacterium]
MDTSDPIQTPPSSLDSASTVAGPLFSTGKKIIFLGAFLTWIGFYMPWFSSITATGPLIDPWKLSFQITTFTATQASGAEIPFNYAWLILGMAFLVVILPDSFPEFGLRNLRLISLAALALGALTIIYLYTNSPLRLDDSKWALINLFKIHGGFIFNIAGYVLLFPGVLMDFAAAARRSS